ncbi:MAG: electron transfer flavoprotein subunit beta/FixA family protein [Phycisphaerales bacterium]|nr:electron transfer flavoprotein subunit beta/FixA family protein [Phycisphaerales bacterium]
MKILVCISKVPDTTSRIAFTNNNTQFDETDIQWILNPYDEWYALVKALELKEQESGSVVHLLTVGTADVDPIIRKGLAIGGDEAIRINLNSADSYLIAQQIAQVAQAGGYDLVLTGKETIDYNSSVIGGLVAEFMNAPYVSLASKLTSQSNVVSIEREIEGGEEIIEASLPLVVSCQKGMAEQRIANMKGIMGARSKPLKVVEPTNTNTQTKIVRFELPPAKTGVKMVAADNVAELVRLLHEEAKII